MSMKKTLIGLGLVAASGAALALPNIAVLATGGTIAGAGASATGTAYQAGKVSVNHLVAAVPELANIANVTPKQVAQIGSQDMSDEVWLKLAQTINADCKKYDGFVITHGTDTMEETAFFLNLVVKSEKPVVLTGAMRPATALSAEGPLNLLNAVRIASDPKAAGRGVLIALNDVIVSARDATKTHPTNVATFRGPDLGMLGMIAGTHIEWIARSEKPHGAATPFTLEALEARVAADGALPRVDIVYSHVDDDGVMVRAAMAAGARAIVHAGTGNGSIHEKTEGALMEAAAHGVLVVRASRTPSGMTVEGLAEWQDAGFVPAGTLNPQKARVLAQLSLACGVDPALAFRTF